MRAARHPNPQIQVVAGFGGLSARSAGSPGQTDASPHRSIELTRGYVAIVDEADFEWLSAFKWHVSGPEGARYAKTKRVLFMHRMIMNAPEGVFVDHANGDPMDNRRVNLRLCTRAQNQQNKCKSRRNRSGFKGVYLRSDGQVWRATIRHGGKTFALGKHLTAEAAARAYDAAAIAAFGEFARLNFPEAGQ